MEKVERSIILRKEDFPKICRFCLSGISTGPTYRIFKLEFENTPFPQILQYLFNKEFYKHDDLPKHICPTCITQVVTFFKFKKAVDTAGTILSSIIKQSEELSRVKVETIDITQLEQKNTNQVENHKEISEEELHTVPPTCDNEEVKSEPTTQQSPQKSPIWTSKNTILDKSASKTVPNSLNTIMCSCLKTFPTNAEYLRHKKRHPEKKYHTRVYHCKICDKFFKRNRFLVHERSQHTNERPFKCKLCPKTFASQTYLMLHTKIHNGEKPFVCDFCGKAFSRTTHLKSHILTHTNEKPYICHVCGRGFNQNPSLKVHMRTHTDEKPFLCSICGKRFAVKAALNTHSLTHDTNKLLCTFCGKKLGSLASLRLHSYTHTGERPYVCTHCGKSFKQSATLQTHSWIHTGEKPFACEVCGKRFARNPQLRVHLRTHSGERPYECEVCKKTFSHSLTLTVHRRSHTNERPYRCDSCHKGFFHSSSMKKHRKKCEQGGDLVK